MHSTVRPHIVVTHWLKCGYVKRAPSLLFSPKVLADAWLVHLPHEYSVGARAFHKMRQQAGGSRQQAGTSRGERTAATAGGVKGAAVRGRRLASEDAEIPGGVLWSGQDFDIGASAAGAAAAGAADDSFNVSWDGFGFLSGRREGRQTSVAQSEDIRDSLSLRGLTSGQSKESGSSSGSPGERAKQFKLFIEGMFRWVWCQPAASRAFSAGA